MNFSCKKEAFHILWTEFLTYACDNINFPQLRLQTVMTVQFVKYYLAVYRHKAVPMRMITTHVLRSQFKTKEELDAKTFWYFILFLPIHHFFTPFSPQM